MRGAFRLPDRPVAAMGTTFRRIIGVFAYVAVTCALATPARAFTLWQPPTLIKLSPGDPAPADGPSETSKGPRYAVSDNGCFAVFTSKATNLIRNQSDGNGKNDVFLYNACPDADDPVISLVSHVNGDALKAANGESNQPVVSWNGSFVVFSSTANDLLSAVPDDRFTGQTNVFLWDRNADTITLVSHVPGDATGPGDADSRNGVLSRAGGRFVAFESLARNLVAGDNNATWDVFRYDGGPLTRVSSVFGYPGPPPPLPIEDGGSFNPAIDGAGNCIVFESEATNLVSGTIDANGAGRDVFLWTPASTTLLSHVAGDTRTTGSDASTEPSISNNCDRFAFKSLAKDLAPDGNGFSDIFYEDPGKDAVLVSHREGAPNTAGNGASDSPILSRDGKSLAYASEATDLSPSQDDTNGASDVFVYDTASDISTLASHAVDEPKKAAGGKSFAPEISTNGLYVAFESEAKDLDPNQNDGNGDSDIFLFYNRPLNNAIVVSRRAYSTSITGNRRSTRPALSGDGYSVAFTSNSGDLVPDDLEKLGLDDTFLYTDFGFLPFFTARSTDNQNVLEWITPSVNYVPPLQVLVTSIVPCFGMQFSDVGWVAVSGVPSSAANTKPLPFSDPSPPNTTRCYGIFAQRDDTMVIDPLDIPRATIVARTLQVPPTGPVKWATSLSGFASLAQAGIGSPNLIAVTNEGGVYGLSRGPSGGFWASGYWPFRPEFFTPIQGRPAVLNLPVLGPTNTAFVGSQGGRAFAIDADQGARKVGGARWYTPALADGVQAATAGMFTLFGGLGDHLLLGTRPSSGPAQFYALNPADGQPEGAPFAGAGFSIGAVNTTASVDYARDQAYVASWKASAGDPSLWCVKLTAAGVDTLTPCWLQFAPANISGGPVERNGVVYVGDDSGRIWAFDANSGAPKWAPYLDCSGGVKSFVFADRQGGQDLYYATTGGGLCALKDLGGSRAFKWSIGTIPNPSAPLFTRIGGTAYVYVGSTDGNLYQVEADNPLAIKSVLVQPGATIGAPAYDVRDGMIYVGSTAGAIYAVQVPLP